MPNSDPARGGIWMSRTENAPEILIRSCSSHDEQRLCVDLQRRIWNFADEDLVPPAIFVVAQHTGGHAYCAFHDGKAVGFALAFSAETGGRRFWHSHMVGVLPDFQNRGVGRMLKSHQREEALRAGVPTIEWTFDPLEPPNAYFNIARLGAIVRHYIPNCYGGSTSPLHGGLPTDRLAAEWHVASERVKERLAGISIPLSGFSTVEIPVPIAIREWRVSDIVRAQEIQSELRNKFMDLFARSYAATGFRQEPEQCVYILERYED
jgi:predicted GNAT superfamily acetyltransferase